MRVPFYAAILLVLIAAFAGISPAFAIEPCCNVTAVDTARQVITIRTKDGKATFELSVADPRQLRAVKVGQAVSLSESSLTLPASGRRAAPPQVVKLTSVRHVPAAGETPSGATSSAASAPEGEFRRGPATKQTVEPATVTTPASVTATQIAVDLPARFDPRAHGFEFTNYYTGDMLVDLPLIGRVDLGNTTYGLCGGMVLAAFDTFNLDANAPDTPTNPPASGTTMRSYLYERQMDSLRRDNWFVVNRLVLWMRKPLKDQTVPNPLAQGGENVLERGLITLSRRQFKNKILPELKRRRPVPIVLVKASGEDLLTNPEAAFTKNHQVLAIGYREVDDNDWEIDIYDPNFANTIQTLHTKGRYQTRRGDSEHTGKFRGYFVAPYEVERPPWVPRSEAIARRLQSVPVVTVSQTESDD